MTSDLYVRVCPGDGVIVSRITGDTGDLKLFSHKTDKFLLTDMQRRRMTNTCEEMDR